MVERFELAPGYSICRVLNGCWQLSNGHTLKGSLDLDDVMRAFRDLVERGFTTFDCADIYGRSEEFIGTLVQGLKDAEGPSAADKIQVHTKFVPDIDDLRTVDAAYVEAAVDRSLARLHKDALDLVQFHWWDYDIPGCVETALHLVDLQKKGKIRHIGVTNFDTDHLAELVDAGVPVVSMQAQYSVFDRRVERRMQAYCAEHGISLICYGTLAGGFLADAWRSIPEPPAEPETRSQVKYLQVIDDSLGWEGYQGLLDVLAPIAEAHGVGVANVATRYVLAQRGVAAAIVGVRNSRHVAQNERIFSFELAEDEVARIRAYIGRFPTVDGEPFEQERTPGSKYRAIMRMNENTADAALAPHGA